MSTQHNIFHGQYYIMLKKIAGVEKRMPMLIGVVHDDDVEKRGWMKKINERKKYALSALRHGRGSLASF